MNSRTGFWLHHCRSDHGWFGIAAGEECTWCGQTEANQPACEAVAAPPIQYQIEYNPAYERA